MLNKNEYNELVGTLEAVYKVDCFGVGDLYRIHELKCGASDRQIFDAYVEAGLEQDLTHRDLDIQDETDGIIHQMLEDLLGEPIEWDVSLVGDVRDSIITRLAKETGLSEYSFHPYMVTFEDQPPVTFRSITDVLDHQFRNEPHVLMEFESLLEVVEGGLEQEEFETEQDAINHLIDVVEDTISHWQTLRRACGPR